jgi:hypothetical protein
MNNLGLFTADEVWQSLNPSLAKPFNYLGPEYVIDGIPRPGIMTVFHQLYIKAASRVMSHKRGKGGLKRVQWHR